jgi:hypothetical protein
MILQKLFESGSIIVLGIVRAVDERNSSVAGRLENWLPAFGFGRELLKITAAKLVPFGGIVIGPFPQFGTWSHVFKPVIDLERSLLYSSGP